MIGFVGMRSDPPADFKAGLRQYIIQNSHWSVGTVPEYLGADNDNNRVSGKIQEARLYTIIDPIDEILGMEDAFRKIREELPKSAPQGEAVAFFPDGVNKVTLDNVLRMNFAGQCTSPQAGPAQTKVIRVILTL